MESVGGYAYFVSEGTLSADLKLGQRNNLRDFIFKHII